MTVYCYDTEFLDDGTIIDLISIGIVSEYGQEYYAVNFDFDQDRLKHNQWMVENVVAQLPLVGDVNKHTTGGPSWYWNLDMKSTLVKPKWVIANEVRDFLLQYDNPELWAYYGAYDHVALAQLWGPMIKLPKGIPIWTHDLMQLLETMPNFTPPEQGAGQHNALEDARWNLAVLTAAKLHEIGVK